MDDKELNGLTFAELDERLRVWGEKYPETLVTINLMAERAVIELELASAPATLWRM